MDENALADAVSLVAKKPVAALTTIPNAGGYSLALRRLVTFGDGTTAFVKAAANELTAEWIAKERVFYEAMDGTPFLPAYFGAGELRDGETIRPFLLLEDLSPSFWPHAARAAGETGVWTSERVQAVLDVLQQVRAQAGRAPANLPNVVDELADFASWHLVAADPGPFLSLGLCSPQWLENALPVLIAAQNAAPIAGNKLLHLDVRSDNLCFRPESGRAVLVDWNWACLGNASLDIAGWLPSLHSEGGPAPEAVYGATWVFAALLSGYWAYRAGLPIPPAAPRVRIVQRQQLETALPWAARVLGLAPLPPNNGGF